MQSLPPSGSGETYDQYIQSAQTQSSQYPRLDSSNQPRHRSVTVPAPIQLPSPGGPQSYMSAGPSSAGSGYFDTAQPMRPPPIVRHASSSAITGVSGATRPTPGSLSLSRRFEPYNSPSISSPRMVISPPLDYNKTQPQGQSQSAPNYFPHHDDPNKPSQGQYSYQITSTPPGPYSRFYDHPSPHQQSSSSNYAPPSAYAWGQSQPQSQSQVGRLMPRDYVSDPPSSSGSSGSTGQPPGLSGGLGIHSPTSNPGGSVWNAMTGHWEEGPQFGNEGGGQGPGQGGGGGGGEWREQGQGTGVAQ